MEACNKDLVIKVVASQGAIEDEEAEEMEVVAAAVAEEPTEDAVDDETNDFNLFWFPFQSVLCYEKQINHWYSKGFRVFSDVCTWLLFFFLCPCRMNVSI